MLLIHSLLHHSDHTAVKGKLRVQAYEKDSSNRNKLLRLAFTVVKGSVIVATFNQTVLAKYATDTDSSCNYFRLLIRYHLPFLRRYQKNQVLNRSSLPLEKTIC